MNNILYYLIIFFVVLGCLTGCSPQSTVEPTAIVTLPPFSDPTERDSVIGTPTTTTEPSFTPGLNLASIQGPLLLIQTDFDQFKYIDPKTQISYPFELPLAAFQFRLSANLSPSGGQMLIPVDENSGLIIDLSSSEVIHTYDFSSPVLFEPEAAAIKAAPLVSEMDFTEAGLLDAVREAHQRSRQLVRWYQSDRYHLSVMDTGETSTSLFLDDHQTGTRLQLEDQPGLVEDYQIGPDQNLVLLKKGLIFWPGAYRDKFYYLINVENRSAQPILLPGDIQNPSVSWFSADTIGVIHHASIAGGSGYSMINIETMQATQIITGSFSDLRRFGEYLLVIQQIDEPAATRFELITTEGETIATQLIERRCFYQYAVSNVAILQCELDSFLLDQDLKLEPYVDSVLTLSPAPDRNGSVMVNRSEQIFLVDADLQIQSELMLEETPLEILWLPDSSGFLYRTHGRLFYFHLESEKSQLLNESDMFSDYINLNAVWVNLE